MKLFTKNKILTISAAILFTALTVPAYAGGYSIAYSGHGGHYSSSYYGRHSNYSLGYGHHNSYGYQQRSYPSYNRKHHNNYDDNYNYNSYGSNSSYKKPCHDVSKTTADEYGQYHKIGGTMCYDSYGQGYIVSGSRYQIQ